MTGLPRLSQTIYGVLLCACWVPAGGQNPQFENLRIEAIRFDPPLDFLAPQDLERVLPLKKDAPFHAGDAAAAIDGLYRTGRFEDIQVDAAPGAAGAVVVTFITKPAWFVGHVEIAGREKAPPSIGQLVNATQLNLGAKYRDGDLDTALQHIKKLLESDGLYEALVQPGVKRDSATQAVNFTFTLKPGPRAKYTFPTIHGAALLSDATILRATSWRIPLIHWWRQVSAARTQSGLFGLHKKYVNQERLTAKVGIESLDYNAKARRVSPALAIDPGPKVSVEAVEAKVSKGALKKYVPIYDEGAVDNDLLVEGARNLRSYFQSKGYYDAEVTFRQDPPEKDRLKIQYVIARGERYRLAQVDFRGNHYFSNGDLRERIFLSPATFVDRRGRYSEAFRLKDAETIANLYKANGFQDVKVTSEVTGNYRGKPQDLAVTFAIEEGRQWFVDSLSLEGVARLDKDAILAKLTSMAGQPYTPVGIASDRNAILTDYYSHGYPAATFQYKAAPSDKPQHMRLTYVVDEGGEEFVRGVLIGGLRITRRGLVDNHMKVHSGEPLAPTEIAAVQRELYNLGVFAKVSATVQNPEGDEQYKYVLYDFEEANRYSANVGVGAEIAQFGGTSTNLSDPGGATGFSPRVSLDVSRLNFLGLGHTVSFRSRVSDLEQLASIEYRAPHFLGADNRSITFAVLYDNARDVRTFSSRREEASVQLEQKLSKATHFQVRFAYRRVSTSDVVIPALLVPQLQQALRIGILSAIWVQDRRDNPADAHRGVYNSVDVGLAANFFGSQRNFARVLAKNATYTRIGKNLVFARQTQIGALLPYNPPAGISANDSVPLPERFFGGGSDSHRGFAFNQAGPRDIGESAAEGGASTEPTGFPLGGNALFFNTFELRFPLIGSNIGGVLFHDAGNVYSSVSDLSLRSSQHNLQDFNYMVHAVGFGIRYRTPIGPIRLDLAYSINPPSFIGFKGTEAELLTCNPNLPIGQLSSYCQGVQQTLSHFQFSFSIGQAF